MAIAQNRATSKTIGRVGTLISLCRSSMTFASFQAWERGWRARCHEARCGLGLQPAGKSPVLVPVPVPVLGAGQIVDPRRIRGIRDLMSIETSAMGTSTPTSPAPQLSPRELEVARLVADGLTNREIAGRLFISERTVDGHLEHVREKLGVNTRAQVAAWVVRQAEPVAAPKPTSAVL